jgi:hypothetical protein
MSEVLNIPESLIGQNRLLRFCLLLIAFCFAEVSTAHNDHPLGKQELDWQPDPSIARTLSLNFDAHAGHFVVVWRAPGGVKTIEGKECIQGPHFLFDIDDEVAFDTDATVTLDLLFDRSDTDGFHVSWDQHIKPNAKRIDFKVDAKERWQRTRITLDRARLANRKYEGTDFSIAALAATYPFSQDESATVTLCDINVHIEAKKPVSQTGLLKLNVANENGLPATVRAGLYADDGTSPLTDESALTVLRYVEEVKQLPLMDTNAFWPGIGRYVFYINGKYQAVLPIGKYQLVISKGPEYRVLEQTINIQADKTSKLKVELERWIDMPASGWYSGDAHIHISRPEQSNNNNILAFTRAEDIHVANLLQMGNVATSHFPQYAFGKAGQFRSGNHNLVPGQESPRTSHVGHTIGLNAKAFHWPEDDYFLYHRTADRIHEDGGLFGYAHVAQGNVFNLDRGLAMDVPLGRVDFLEVMQKGILNTKHLYNFLNLGYRLLPAAGSDYPYIHIAGTERNYVQVKGEFSPQSWFESWTKGRAMVSNGPVLTFSVNGNQSNNQIEIDQGETVDIKARARVNPDLDELQTLELVVHGEVVATARASNNKDIELHYSLKLESSAWLALRTRGQRGAIAHTSPYYVLVDGEQRFWKPQAVEEISRHYIEVLKSFHNSTPQLDEEWELFNTEAFILPKWKAAKVALDEQISLAIEAYMNLIKTSRQ